MISGAVVLRPEPGNAATAARLLAAGFDVLRAPLFAIEAVSWRTPDLASFDALLLTSANAVRTAGSRLQALAHLPILAVGAATASAVRDAGLTVRITGDRDAAALAATAHDQGFKRLLHLTGADHVDLPGVEAVPVYHSVAIPLAPDGARAWQGHVALLHSARAARRFAELVDRDAAKRSRIAVAALSPAVLAEAGQGWAAGASAETPSDAALVACAAALIDRSRPAVDKRPR